MNKKLNDHDYQVVHQDSPSYVHEEEENIEFWITPEIKNKTVVKWLLAGVGIVGFFCLLQGI